MVRALSGESEEAGEPEHVTLSPNHLELGQFTLIQERCGLRKLPTMIFVPMLRMSGLVLTKTA